MTKPRIFISSTFYDLKHIRSSVDQFIESLGFEPILSEKGDIAFMPDMPLDESCYREAANADIFVLIIGGRYGTEAQSKSKTPTRTFFERYESITKREYESAVTRDIPIYILIDASVYAEYQTYLRNKERTDINYAHVDSINIFKFIEEILVKPRNNPVHTFEKFSEIEVWLREQWAGFFHELLQRSTQQQQLATLSSQIQELRENNATLKRYLEAVMTGITPDDSTKLIESEQKRLEEIERKERLKDNRWAHYIEKNLNLPIEKIEDLMKDSHSYDDFCKRMALAVNKPEIEKHYISTLRIPEAKNDFNKLRDLMGLKPFEMIKKGGLSVKRVRRKLPPPEKI